MQHSIELAGEPISAGRLCVIGDDGMIYQFRHETREAIIGVAIADTGPGRSVSFLPDGDAISEALLKDFVDRN